MVTIFNYSVNDAEKDGLLFNVEDFKVGEISHITQSLAKKFGKRKEVAKFLAIIWNKMQTTKSALKGYWELENIDVNGRTERLIFVQDNGNGYTVMLPANY